MTLDKSFNVVEPYAKRQFPDQPYAPAWLTMWLEQHKINDPTNTDLEHAAKALRARLANTIRCIAELA